MSTASTFTQINLLISRQHGGMVFTSRYRFGRRGIQIHGKRVPQNPVRLHVSISELYCCFSELCIYTTIPWFRTCKENTTYEVKFLHCRTANPYLAKQKILIRFTQHGTKCSELCGICCVTALSCGGQPVNGEGQLLSDVQILMLIGQIVLHCNLPDSQQRPAVKEREWQNWNGKDLAEKELRNDVVLNSVSAFGSFKCCGKWSSLTFFSSFSGKTDG